MKVSKYFIDHCRFLVFISITLIPVFVRAQGSEALQLDLNHLNELNAVSLSAGGWQLTTIGKDPWIQTTPLISARKSDQTVLAFEYFCAKGLDQLQVFFGPVFSADNMKLENNVGLAEGWVGYSIELAAEIKEWGKPRDRLRLDFGTKANVEIQIRNIVMRSMTGREKQIAETREAKKMAEAQMESRLKSYLSTEFPSEIAEVTVNDNLINIKGKTSTAKNVYLCEVSPYQDVTEDKVFDNPLPIKSVLFDFKVQRFIKRNGLNYDRLLSKWVVAKKTKDGYELLSHARFPGEIKAKYDLPKEVAKGRKGIGGFSIGRGHTSDLDDLNVTSATVNIWFSKFMFTKPGEGRIEHSYNGKSYYFRQKDVALFDSTFLATSRKGIVTAAILLVDKAEKCPDPEIGRLLQHPDMDPAGIYSMPNMTNPASVDCYAAALDFLASRYSRPDKKYGRLNHWIMHNEVDAGWEWTNMGEKTAAVFMDTYVKSMRLCYAIARNYNPHSEVFITLTHYWAWTSHPRFYHSKDLMEILLQYTKAEGDFEWAMAHHPYPQSLREPKTWLDQQVDFTFNSPLITFKNLEVLDAWIKQPSVLYQGKTKRTLWLSENGTNSKTYSEQDLKEQAAGFAYAWKKMKVLDGIDGFQWHNWIDNRNEGGLRIGLRRFPDDEEEPGGTKPVWYVFKAADTKEEDAIFDVYKKTIGIDDWSEVIYRGKILK